MQEEKNRIERVLGAISAPDLIQKVLNFALSVHVYCTLSNVDVVPACDVGLPFCTALEFLTSMLVMMCCRGNQTQVLFVY